MVKQSLSVCMQKSMEPIIPWTQPVRGKLNLSHLIHQNIINGNGLCLISAHCSLYDNIVKWIPLNQRYLKSSNFIFLKPAEDEWAFNLTRIGSAKILGFPLFLARLLNISSKSKCGYGKYRSNPLPERYLGGLFYALSTIIYPCLIRNIVKPRIKEIRSYTAVQDNPTS